MIRSAEIFLGVVASFFFWTTLLDASAVPSKAQFDEAMATLLAMPEQSKLERLICQEELAAGVAAGKWTAEDETRGLKLLEEIYAEPEPEPEFDELEVNQQIARSFSIVRLWGDFVARALNFGSAEIRSMEPFTEFSRRVSVLSAEYMVAAVNVWWAGLNYCDEVWREARVPADLAPAFQVLTELKNLDPTSWAATSAPRAQMAALPHDNRQFSRNAGMEHYAAMIEVGQVYSVLGSRDPLIFPNPLKDVAGFRAALQVWNQLAGLNHGFTQRPANCEWVLKLREVYDSELAARIRKVNSLLLADASADDLEREIDQILPRQLNQAQQRPVPFPPGVPGRSLDFRDMLRDPRVPPGMIINRGTAAQSESVEGVYYLWVDFLRARNTRDEAKQKRLAEELRAGISKLSPQVSSYILARLPSVEEKPASGLSRLPSSIEKDPPSGDLVIDLINRLKKIKEAGSVAEAWSRVRDFKSNELSQGSNEIVMVWSTIERVPDHLDVFDLRDEAVRQLIYEISGNRDRPRDDSNAPVSMLLRRALEESVRLGNVEKTGRLLKLNAISGVMERNWQKKYEALLKLISSVLRAESRGETQEAIGYCKLLLREAESEGAVEYSLAALKRLRTEGAGAKESKNQ